MAQPQRSSDVVESHSEHALTASLIGLALLAFGFLLWRYQGEGWFLPLSYLLLSFGAIAMLYGIYAALQVRKVEGVVVQCPFCNAKNMLTEQPTGDVSCNECHRMIPITADGTVLPVSQVRCGYCNELNYYSSKTEVLVCEYCNHEIPIAQEEGKPTKHLPSGYAIQEDHQLYELRLIATGPRTEELIGALQHMLALNRNQVKQMLDELPVTLLTGITRKKAEMLRAQLAVHEAAAEFTPLP
jgi:ribosomal protein S27E